MKEKKVKEKKQKKTSEKNSSKVKFPISLKLGTIFSILIVLVLGTSTLIIYRLLSSEEEAKAEENNQTINSRTATSIESMFMDILSDSNGYLNTLLLLDNDGDFTQKQDILFNDLCARNSELQFIYTTEGLYKTELKFGETNPESKENFEKWLKSNEKVKNQVLAGKFAVENLSPVYEIASICILYPHFNPLSSSTELVAVGFDSKKYDDILATGSFNSTFLVNENGTVLIHSDFEKILSAENLSYLMAVQTMKNSLKVETQNLYPDENGKNWYYAVNPIADGAMFVITCVAESDVFETINHIAFRIACISFAVLFLAIILIRFFSKTMTYPIEKLVDATNQIETGNYDIELKATSKDEIGQLTQRFTDMTSGLKERYNLLRFTRKSVNPIIAEKALSGKLHLGGENKTATIFFSDIRNFTAMSEKMTAQETVGFLNKYMTHMVGCVEKSSGGIVDKYIGDAIMAVWGGAVSSGSVAGDAWNAVKAALMMRIALYEINQGRIAVGREPFRIGCGINTGNVVAGFIGSEADNQKWEYTVIGDAVNLASRTEALNKPFATDILITENTYELIKDKIIVEEMPEVHVKGKEKPVKMYAVINAVGIKGPSDIESLRKFLGVKAPDLKKVNPDEEEKKYEVLS